MGGQVVGERGEFGGVAAEAFISYTVNMTRQCGACALTSRAVRSASSNLGSTRMRVLIFSR